MVTDRRGKPPQFLRRVRNRPSLRRRGRVHAMIRAFVVLGGMAMGGLGASFAYQQALKLPALSVKRVVLREVPAELIDAVRAELEPAYGRNLLALDLRRLRQRIVRLPRVRSANVRRVLPDGLVVTVESRQPRALLRAADGHYLVDGEGVVIAGPDVEPDHWPTVRLASTAELRARPGQTLTELAMLAAPLRSALAIIGWLERDGSGLNRPVDHLRIDQVGVVLVLRQPALEVVVGDEQSLAEKFAALRTMLAADPPTAPVVIDVRYREMLVVRDLRKETE